MEALNIQPCLAFLQQNLKEIGAREVLVNRYVRDAKIATIAARCYSRSVRDRLGRGHIGRLEIRKATMGPLITRGFFFTG